MTDPQHDMRPGLAAAFVVFCVYACVALSVDFPRAAFGLQSDEATYYMMGHSLASDGDLAYRREDLARVWREFPSGPVGVFLKRGNRVEVTATADPPYVGFRTQPHADSAELFFGKSYLYPLLASPFVALMGTNGFLFLHALLLGLVVLAAYAFLNARSSPMVSVMLSVAFVMASVVPVYTVWITPELLNFALVVLGYFCWLYKEVAPPASLPRGAAWLLRPQSNLAALVLLGLATFSKPSLAVLIVPMLLWFGLKRSWRTAAWSAAVFVLVGAVCLAGNAAITGDWNYQGGDRKTFYGPFPFQTRTAQWESVGQVVTTNRVLTEVIFDGRVFWRVFAQNLGYIAVGRYSGLVPYFFPAVFATAAFLLARRRRAAWQWLVLAAGLAEIVLLIVWMPYTHAGGGGGNGHRYFLGAYGIFLFILPPFERAWLTLIPWAVGTLFSGQIAFNPFFAAFHPAEAAKQGPLRLLPVELTMVEALPFNAQGDSARGWFGEHRRFQVFFVDDNAYPREDGHFWTRGRSRTEFIVKTAEPARQLDLALTAGPIPVRVTASRFWGRAQAAALQPGETRVMSIPLDQGFPYQGTRVWHIALDCDDGFVPMFREASSTDLRYLGVRVSPELRR